MIDMRCQQVQKSVSAYLDRELAGAVAEHVAMHLASCRECAATVDQQAYVRNTLRQVPQLAVPDQLATELQVLASHEQTRRSPGSTSQPARGIGPAVRAW